MNNFFAVIVHFNHPTEFERTYVNLNSFLSSEFICVIDNSSSLKSDTLEEYHAMPNIGFAAGMNFGVNIMKEKYPNMDYALLISHEVIIKEDDIKLLHSTIQDQPQVACVGPTLYLENGIIWSTGGSFNQRGIFPRNMHKNVNLLAKTNQVDWLDGACIYTRVSDFLEVGGYPEFFFLYMEDVALGVEFRKKNKKIVLRADAKATQETTGVPRRLAIRNSLILSLVYFSKYRTLKILIHSMGSFLKSSIMFDFKASSERLSASVEAFSVLLKLIESKKYFDKCE